jgi:hypothetical protein
MLPYYVRPIICYLIDLVNKKVKSIQNTSRNVSSFLIKIYFITSRQLIKEYFRDIFNRSGILKCEIRRIPYTNHKSSTESVLQALEWTSQPWVNL